MIVISRSDFFLALLLFKASPDIMEGKKKPITYKNEIDRENITDYQFWIRILQDYHTICLTQPKPKDKVT